MRVKVIINPAAGQAEPILSVLNDVLGRAGIEWDVAITHKSGDGLIAARAAAGQGYDLIGAYGGAMARHLRRSSSGAIAAVWPHDAAWTIG